MKKFFALCLALTTLLSLGTVSAFAETATNTGSKSADVEAQYVAGEHQTVYSVDITWGAMEFNYNAHETWNTESHTWDPTNPEWVAAENSNTVTVANNSSVAIDATFSFAPKSDYNFLSGNFSYENNTLSGSKLALSVAEANTAATVHTVTFIPSGALPAGVSANTVIGTITITLSEAASS